MINSLYSSKLFLRSRNQPTSVTHFISIIEQCVFKTIIKLLFGCRLNSLPVLTRSPEKRVTFIFPGLSTAVDQTGKIATGTSITFLKEKDHWKYVHWVLVIVISAFNMLLIFERGVSWSFFSHHCFLLLALFFYEMIASLEQISSSKERL